MYRQIIFLFLLTILAFSCSRKSGTEKTAQPSIEEIALFPVLSGGLFGFIDVSGKMVIPPSYLSVNPFSEGIAQVEIKGGSAYILPNGDFAFKARFKEFFANDFREGLAAVKTHLSDGKYIYINRQGEQAFPGYFELAGFFSEGLAPIRKDYRWGYIDKKGQVLTEPQYYVAYEFQEGLAVVASGEKQFGIIRKNGTFISDERYEETGEKFSEGLLSVYRNGKWGFVNNAGRLVIDFGFTNPVFEDVPFFKGGLAAASDSLDRWGFIDRTGKWVIEPQYEWALPFSQGLAGVQNAAGWMFIDTQNNPQIEDLQVEWVKPFQNGLAQVMIEEKWNNYINLNGVLVWRNP